MSLSFISPGIVILIDLVFVILIICFIKSSNIRGKFWGILLLV